MESRLGYRFRHRRLLQRALTHRSFSHDRSNPRHDEREPDYEALEFFGDSILSLIVSEALLVANPNQREGVLSKMRAQLVSAEQLAKLSADLGVGRYLRLSYGEEKTGGRRKRAILSDVFESLTAAVYLDGGLEPARRFVLAQFDSLLEQVKEERFLVWDFKSALQEHLHSQGQNEPLYRVISEKGPDHRKEFEIEVVSQNQRLALGTGFSKKEAEQEAAQSALRSLESSD